MDVLKPCPFCGCYVFVVRKRGSEIYKILGDHDMNCVFSELGWYGGYNDEKTAVKAWNRRYL